MNGACLCGEVRFELAGGLPALYQCHCSLCRRQGGSASNSATLISTDRFRWLCGDQSIRKWQKPSGFSSHFCQHCGSPVPNLLGDSGYVWVPAGLLETKAHAQIVAHLFVGSRAPWDRGQMSGKRFETMPALPELAAILGGSSGTV